MANDMRDRQSDWRIWRASSRRNRENGGVVDEGQESARVSDGG